MANNFGEPFRKRQPIKKSANLLKLTPQSFDDPVANAMNLISTAAKVKSGGVAPPAAKTLAIPIRPPSALRARGVPGEPEAEMPTFGNVTSIVTPQAEDRGGVVPGKEKELMRAVSMKRSLEEQPLKKPEATPVTATDRGVAAVVPGEARDISKIDIPLTTAGEGATRDLFTSPSGFMQGTPATEFSNVLAEQPGFFESLKNMDPKQRANFEKALLTAGTSILEASHAGTAADVSRGILTGVEAFEGTKAAEAKAAKEARGEGREERGERREDIRLGLAEEKAKRRPTLGQLRSFTDKDGIKKEGFADPVSGKIIQSTVLSSGSRTGEGGVSTTLRDFEAASGILPGKRGTPEYLEGLKTFRKDIFGREDKPQEAFVRDWVAKNADELSSDKDILDLEAKAGRIYQGVPKTKGAEIRGGGTTTTIKKRPPTGSVATDSILREIDKRKQQVTGTESFRDFL